MTYTSTSTGWEVVEIALIEPSIAAGGHESRVDAGASDFTVLG
jgi:hypothetical protein